MSRYEFPRPENLNASKLKLEIFNSISKEVKVTTKGSNVIIVSDSPLSSGEQDTISGIISSHVASNIRNKDSGHFIVETYDDITEVKILEYGCYMTRVGNVFSNPVCRDVYNYDELGKLTSISKYRYYEDNTEELYKTITVERVVVDGDHLVIKNA